RLPDMFGTVEIVEVVHAQIAELNAVRDTLLDQRGRNRRHQYLTTVPDSPQPSTMIYRWTIIVTGAQLGLAGVKGDSHAEWLGEWPILLLECPLDVARCDDCIRSAQEDCEPAVALSSGPHDSTAMLGYQAFDQLVMPPHCVAH